MRDRWMFLTYVMAVASALLVLAWVGSEPYDPEERLRYYTECYAELIGIVPPWEIAITFDSLLEDEGATAAEPTYYVAEIEYNPQHDGMASDSALRANAVHEVLHVWLWELAEPAWALDPAARVEEQTISVIDRRPFWRKFCP